ncbi:adenosylcobinamide-GDP ribazoletransferase [Roseomonas sp. M0104]|uniref:Adenosylcobinamide-GDP ribazoletransferase n=1 Tax=Teichococcus coralli TaxID=2545983 RepID=A0A845BL58_9PROT|nr:adenosylcobinamide-GDP ribazoletransferase [Pseudoroseomonas coralli]MXP64139.1 adenosylcobinamide-GDP ribazoletransferase [Pseudoroseomonas coralli]
MLRARFAELAAAFGLLTRLPVGALPQPPDAAGYARAAWAWPLAGAAVGALGGAAQALLTAAGLPPALAAPWALAAMLLASGALHEDGLADTADGFGGARNPARKLEIMRDSRIGSFGALALVLSLALRGGALAELAAPLPAMAAAGALARLAMLLPLLALPPARRDGLAAGLGRPPLAAALGALAVAAILAALLLPAGAALLALGAALAGAAALAALAGSQIGGQTGDVLGASAVLAECAALSVLVALR